MEIRWSPRAVDDYEVNISFLLLEWSEREVALFIEKVAIVLKNIRRLPEMYPVLEDADVSIRKAVVVKQISLIYLIEPDHVLLLNFWNNYQDPESLYNLLER